MNLHDSDTLEDGIAQVWIDMKVPIKLVERLKLGSTVAPSYKCSDTPNFKHVIR